MKKMKSILPGLLLCIAIAMIGKSIGYFIPSLGAGLFAILLGIVVGNMPFSSHESLRPGIKFSESNLLYYSIILLGATLTFHSIFEIGFSGIAFILIQMGVTIAFVIWLGRQLQFEQDFCLLMASGNAVCGSSAIAATAPALSAKVKDMAVSITVVNLLGTVMMITLPAITSVVFQNEVLPSSALIGGTLQSVGQVVASGNIVGEVVKDQAAVFKISRIIFLAAVVFILQRVKHAKIKKEIKDERFNIKNIVPWYVAGFLLLCTINSLIEFPEFVTHPIKEFGNYLEIIALAGIGMSVKIKDLTQHGWRITAYAGGVGIFQVTVALILIFLLLL